MVSMLDSSTQAHVERSFGLWFKWDKQNIPFANYQALNGWSSATKYMYSVKVQIHFFTSFIYM